jgi:hypothetical protein
VSCYKLVRKGFRSVTWFVVSSLPPSQERFVAYIVDPRICTVSRPGFGRIAV